MLDSAEWDAARPVEHLHYLLLYIMFSAVVVLLTPVGDGLVPEAKILHYYLYALAPIIRLLTAGRRWRMMLLSSGGRPWPFLHSVAF